MTPEEPIKTPTPTEEYARRRLEESPLSKLKDKK